MNKPINQQTAGPLLTGFANRHSVTLWVPGIRDIALLPRNNDQDEQPEADAALLAASYTAFDKAGRELGVDATELAKTIDLAGLIRAARDVKTEHANQNPGDTETPLDMAIYRLAGHLPSLRLN